MKNKENDMPDQIEIERALLTIANPVAVLIVKDGDEINGMIASWITQVSYDPPMVLIGVHPSRYTHHMLQSVGKFTLNLLAQGQEDLVAQFKLKGGARDEKILGLKTGEGENEQPYLKDCAAVLECTVIQSYDMGDHTLFIGEVTNAGVSEKKPLTTISLGKGYLGKS